MTPSKARFEKSCEDHRLIPTTEVQRATKKLMERAWLAAEHGWFMRVKAAHMNLCTCGGGGPEDPHICQVCKLYHAIELGNEEL